jgi:hypothetical protein
MKNAKQATVDQFPTDRAASIISRLKARGVRMSLIWDVDAAVIEAYVPSGQAARMLAPLGRWALGQFKAMPGNMVLIDAIVTHRQAEQMLRAAHATA